MPITSAQQASLYRLTIGMFGAAPGTVYLDQLSEAVLSFMAAGQSATGAVTSLFRVLQSNATFQAQNFAYSDSSTDSQFATYFINQLLGTTVTDAAKADGVTYVTNQLTAGKTRGEAIEITLNALAAVPVSDATYGKAAQQLANKVSVAQNYTETLSGNSTNLGTLQGTISTVNDTAASVTAANTANSGGSAAGQTFTLTTGFDNIAGGSANDTINGSVAGTITVTAGDVIDGGSGVNTLRLAGAGASATTLSGTTLKNIQVLDLINPGDNTQDLSSQTTSGLTTVVIEDASPMSGKTITSPAGLINLQLATAGGIGTTGAVTWAGPSAATALNLTLNGYQGVSGGTPLALTVTGAAAATQNITSQTAANAITTLTLSTATKTVNITDNTNLSISTSLTGTAVTSVVATGAGTLTVAGSNLANAGLTVDASAATGAVSFAVEAGATTVTFKGGTGNDTVTFGAGDLASASAQTVDGGTGTDTVNINDTTPVYSVLNKMTNVEVLGLSTTGATVDVSQLTSINAFKVNGNISETFNNAVDTTTFTISGAAGAGTIAINDAVGSSATKVTVDYAAATSAQTVTALNFTGAGTIALVSTGTGTGGSNVITTLGNIDNSSITVTGSKGLTITNALAATTTGSKYDASAATGAQSVVGSSKADILIGGTGNDTLANQAAAITASAGDILTGGAGNDAFVLRGSVASGTVSTILSTASRISDFTVGASATVGDVLTLSAAIANYSAAGAAAAGGIAVAAAGATAVQSVAQNAAAAAYTAAADLIKLTTGVTATGTFQAAFDAAIGTATVTGFTADDQIFFTLYDTTNSRMEIGIVRAGAANTVVAAADVVVLVGSVNMTATDYASFGANSLAIVA